MAKPQQYQPPKRKEPGLLGNLFSALVQLVVWLIISLMLSIIIEWIGMIWFWPEMGSEHAKAVLATDQTYLNQQLYDQSIPIKNDVVATTHQAVTWIAHQSWFETIIQMVPSASAGTFAVFQEWAHDLYQQYRDYLQASTYVTQTFVIRLVLIVFSLPIFLLAALVGGVDGLVERDLRRWGGGRESSNVFNLARRSIVPAFIAACVVYISLPIGVSPVIVILPFAILLGLAVRITFERLKKYF
ncbi:TIGR03747 family integrating conjugative element membrane protein [Oceanicoccus sp. KOV_DT_Chl]|uniref:TIGR03747 family integrating conjugative element membrane protein n=1 Tax=Oceanicoccus sp. KOV_DT_Chl TaxID=1904639 RepID=UPI000C7C98DB|nr:TIGR03747 family integrating conjugative element membrane protein [Oceanicoccus sp. KOV_DT_Chl]